MAGRVTVTGRASAIEAGSPVRWTGATRPSGSVAPPLGSTSYTLTKSTASPVGLAARRRTTGAPTTSTVDVSGADEKSACWPGRSRTAPLSRARAAPVPGSDDTAPGVPLGGLATGWGGPASRTVVVDRPARPGYAGTEYPSATTPLVPASIPATLE